MLTHLSMFFSGEAVYRTFTGGTLIFIVSCNVDEVRPIKSTARLRAGRRWLGQDGSDTGILALLDLLRTEVAAISYGFKPGLTHRIASGPSHRSTHLRPKNGLKIALRGAISAVRTRFDVVPRLEWPKMR
jgi:hypothetical protein